MLATLDNLLADLRTSGIVPDATETALLERLFERAPSLDDFEVREALASCLVKDKDQRETFDLAFERWAAQPLPRAERGEPRLDIVHRPHAVKLVPRPEETRWRDIGYVVIAALIMLGLVALLRPKVETTAPQSTTPPAPVANDGSRPPVEPAKVWSNPNLVDLPPEKIPPLEWHTPGSAQVRPFLSSGRFRASVLALFVALGAAAACFLFYRRLRLPEPLPLPAEGPRWLPPLVREPANIKVLDDQTRRALVWGVGRFVTEDFTGRWDIPRSVKATADAAGIATLVPEHERREREVWLWYDAATSTHEVDAIRRDLEQLFRGAHLVCRTAWFVRTPSLVCFDDSKEEVSPLALEAWRQTAVVLVLSDGSGLRQALDDDSRRIEIEALLRHLRAWEHLRFIALGEQRDAFRMLLTKYGIAALEAGEIGKALSGVAQSPITKRPARAERVDLYARGLWESAATLVDRPLSVDWLLELRQHLELEVDPLEGAEIIARRQGRSSFTLVERAERLSWWLDTDGIRAPLERGADAVRGRSVPRRFRVAIDAWRDLFADERRVREAAESVLAPWKDSSADQSLRLEEALIELFLDPIAAAPRLDTLAHAASPEFAAAVRATLSDYVPRPDKGKPLGGRGPRQWLDPRLDEEAPRSASIVLPWSWSDLHRVDPNAMWQLRRSGLGAGSGRSRTLALAMPRVLKLAVAMTVALFCVLIGRIFVGDAPPPKPFPEPLRMIELEGGSFDMGLSPGDEPPSDDEDWKRWYEAEKPRHEVRLSPFAMSETVVTRRLFRAVMGRAPSEWSTGVDHDLLPANYVSWFDAVRFCNALSDAAGLDRCYEIVEAVESGRNPDVTLLDSVKSGYRLPTEAEWEYAARGGKTTRFWWGDSLDDAPRHAWFEGNSDLDSTPNQYGEVHRVDDKGVDDKAVDDLNPFLLRGMAGNVWQWCQDWSSKNYSNAERVDPRGPNSPEELNGYTGRLLRGGSAWDVAGSLRVSGRGRGGPEVRVENIGFRVVRSPRRQP